MIGLNLSKVSGKRKEQIIQLIENVDNVSILTLQVLYMALEYKNKLIGGNQALDFAMSLRFDSYLVEILEVGNTNISSEKLRSVLKAKSLLDNHIHECTQSYIVSKRQFKLTFPDAFQIYSLLGKMQIKTEKFVEKFKEAAKDNYMLELHFQRRLQVKLNEFIQFKIIHS